MLKSLLFLPGNNPNMLVNGGVLGADAVIFDLEDSVSPNEKDAARILVRNALRTSLYPSSQKVVRINAIDANGFWMQDLDEIIPCRPDIILPPKVDSPEYIHTLSAYVSKLEEENHIQAGSTKFLPLIETMLGLENSYLIAKASARVTALFLGAEDLTADMYAERTKGSKEIFYARARIVSAARAAGIEVYDTPFTDVYDDEGLLEDAKCAKALGFTGKVSISPRHVKMINSVFSPTQDEIDYAHEVLEAIELANSQGKGAIALYGKMIDAPIVARAKHILGML